MADRLGRTRDGLTRRDFSCQRDGRIVHGTEYRPVGANLPVAIVSHGLMANRGSVRRYAMLLAGLGYAAYCFDFSGGSASGNGRDGGTIDMSVLTGVSDLEAVAEYASGLPDTDGSRVFLMGCSLGGFVSALAAARMGSRVCGLALFYPAFDIPDDARHGKAVYARFDPNHVPKRLPCGPVEMDCKYVLDVLDMDGYGAAAAYPGPVLLVHGTADEIVPYEVSARAFEAYAERPAGASVRLERVDGGGHGFIGRHDAVAMEFLAEFARPLMK